MEQGGWQVVLDKDAGSLMWEVGLSLSRFDTDFSKKKTFCDSCHNNQD